MKRVLTVLIMLFSALSATAAGSNVLQTIQIDPIKDTYNIVLTADEAVDVKKTVQDSNRIVLNLKGIRASKTLNTIYNNTTSVDTVMVEPGMNNSLNIFIQADNAADSTITFDSLSATLGAFTTQKQGLKSHKQKIQLSQPIKNYTPVYQAEEEETQEYSNFDGIISPAMIQNVKNALKDEKVNKTITYGLVAIMILSAVKLLKGKEQEEPIGLAQSMREREINMHKASVQPMNLPAKLEKPYTTSNLNYGLKAYQSQYPNTVTPSAPKTTLPQATVPTGFHSSPKFNTQKSQYMQAVAPTVQRAPQAHIANTAIMQRPIQVQKPVSQTAVVNPIQQRTATPKVTNIDSMKFLESMTKIYEKNGRHDLAQGLKANIDKAKRA